MNIQKFTNARWLGLIAPEIERFFKKVKPQGMTYESLYTYIAQIVQFGGNTAEFWVVFDEGKPVGFMNYSVLALPYISTAGSDCICSWGKPEVAEMLVNKWINFARINRCKYLRSSASNKKLISHYRKLADKTGFKLKQTGSITFICEEKDEDIPEDKD